MNNSDLTLAIDVPLQAASAFDVLIDDLTSALTQRGLRFYAEPNGRVMQGAIEVGRVKEWQPGERFRLEWQPTPWQPDAITEIEFVFEATATGTRVTVSHRNWSGQIGDGAETIGWFVAQVAAPVITSLAPAAFGDWITDRRARKPSGTQSRETYRDPLFHYPGFRVVLAELALQPNDYLLEVGCGGGAMLKQALQSGCRAAAIDHSADMVRTAIATNEAAVRAGRLEVVEAAADKLPFADNTFTCAAMTGVLGFLPDPVAVFAEMKRVLNHGGRIVVAGSDPELRGTPGAPEPMASRLRFYDDDDFADLAKDAGFTSVRVVRRDLEQHARAVGIPEEYVFLFAGDASRFLWAQKT